MACCSPSSSTPMPTTMSEPTTAIASPKVHIHLHVRDLAASVNFYRALFGTEPVKLLPGYAKFLPSWGPVNLALSQSDADARGSVVSHVGIQLASPSDVKRQLARLTAAGLPCASRWEWIAAMRTQTNSGSWTLRVSNGKSTTEL
jgi:predicted enzyme related to lactoylglutathione lyase